MKWSNNESWAVILKKGSISSRNANDLHVQARLLALVDSPALLFGMCAHKGTTGTRAQTRRVTLKGAASGAASSFPYQVAPFKRFMGLWSGQGFLWAKWRRRRRRFGVARRMVSLVDRHVFILKYENRFHGFDHNHVAPLVMSDHQRRFRESVMIRWAGHSSQACLNASVKARGGGKHDFFFLFLK